MRTFPGIPKPARAHVAPIKRHETLYRVALFDGIRRIQVGFGRTADIAVAERWITECTQPRERESMVMAIERGTLVGREYRWERL